MEVLTINATLPGAGLGSRLMLAVINLARQRKIERVWLTTTNDSLHAVGFYQRLGFRLTEIHPGVVDEARKTKPQIPEVGQNGIPIHDELVMELRLQPSLGVEHDAGQTPAAG
jgi:ribosomal protein S18 acetylase RimI-like enzyme